ncbi:uncharacterized protein LOC135389558 [Ornithodoros turicata]|uniref:uncharacterized protein LOC135389558 n=1 Tax=Ornithodoros turicata TaxID=34597 RepID=UPI003138B7B2
MREKNKNLKIQLAKVQEELEKERELCRGLQEVLLKKFEESTIPDMPVQAVDSAERFAGQGDATATYNPTSCQQVAESHPAPPVHNASASIQMIHGNVGLQFAAAAASVGGQGQELSEANCTNEALLPPVMASVGNKVHLGNGIFIADEKMTWMMQTKSDSKFLREVVRTIWSPEELRGRSITGKPCQRLLKNGTTAKRALTPRKLMAVTNAFQAFVNKNACPKGLTVQQRTGMKNRLLADFLKTM